MRDTVDCSSIETALKYVTIFVTGGQRVVITPQGNQMTTTESDVTLTCTLVDYTPPPYYRKSGVRLIWHGPHSQEIATTDGR